MEEGGAIVDWLKDFDTENRGDHSQRGPTVIFSSAPEKLHKAIKHALVSRRKISKPSILGSTVFRFTLYSNGRPIQEAGSEGIPASLNIIELSSKCILSKLEKERCLSASTSGYAPGLRRLYGAYSSHVISSLCQILQPSLQVASLLNQDFHNIFLQRFRKKLPN